MGRYYDRRNPPVSQLVRVGFDPSTLPPLGCTKTPDEFIRDLIDRSATISDVVIHNDTDPTGTSGSVEYVLVFTSLADLNQIIGTTLNWLDADTRLVLIPVRGASTIHLVLTVSPAGTQPPGHSEPQALLV